MEVNGNVVVQCNRCQQFSLTLLSTEEIVTLKTVEIDVHMTFFECDFPNF